MMNSTDVAVYEHLKRPLNGRTGKAIAARTGLTLSQVADGLRRLRKAGHLKGWEVVRPAQTW